MSLAIPAIAFAALTTTYAQDANTTATPVAISAPLTTTVPKAMDDATYVAAKKLVADDRTALKADRTALVEAKKAKDTAKIATLKTSITADQAKINEVCA